MSTEKSPNVEPSNPVAEDTPTAEGARTQADVVRMTAPETKSLTLLEWESMEKALDPETEETHFNLQIWMRERAAMQGIKQEQDLEYSDESDGECSDPESDNEHDQLAKDTKAKSKEIAEKRSWSLVSPVFFNSKLNFEKPEDKSQDKSQDKKKDKKDKPYVNTIGFTNWVWFTVIRNELLKSEGELPERCLADYPHHEEAIARCFAEFLPEAGKSKKKAEKPDKSAKKVDEIKTNSTEKVQISNLIKNMIYGDKTKNKGGWAWSVANDDFEEDFPWEFQCGHILFKCFQMEHRAQKKKVKPDRVYYYELMQALADCITTLRKQYLFYFGDLMTAPTEQGKSNELETHLMPLQDLLQVQARVMTGNTLQGQSYKLSYYLSNCAHLLAGSFFSARHTTTIFKPFDIQQQMVDTILQPGPQLIFAISPPGSGKTAITAHVLNLFPDHNMVFVCAALPVVLGVGQIAFRLALPYAFVKDKCITPSYQCGIKLGHQRDLLGGDAVKILSDRIEDLNRARKEKRLAVKKKSRRAMDYKKMPKLFLCRDITSAAWLLKQLPKDKSVLIIDEPPMMSDYQPRRPNENLVSMCMTEAMLTPMYKTILMSATMPRPAQLPTIVDNFCDVFNVTDRSPHIRECFSAQLDRGVLLVRPDGRVAFPHENCDDVKSLRNLVDMLPYDPLTLKSYTERSLNDMLERRKKVEKKLGIVLKDEHGQPIPDGEQKFADISRLRPDTIRLYCIEILRGVVNHGSDEVVKQFCKPVTSFPHEACSTVETLARFLEDLREGSPKRKGYTRRILGEMLERRRKVEKKKEMPLLDAHGVLIPSSDDLIASLAGLSGRATEDAIQSACVLLLEGVLAWNTDDYVERFCKGDKKDSSKLANDQIFPDFDLQNILFANAHYFPGSTLVASQDPAGQCMRMIERLREYFPKEGSIEADMENQVKENARVQKYMEDEEKEKMGESNQVLRFPAELVVQSKQFLKKWCKTFDPDKKYPTRQLPSAYDYHRIKELPVDYLWKMLALAGISAFDMSIDHDVKEPKFNQWVSESMQKGKLACVTAGTEFTWGVNMPASTVIVTDEFAESTSVSGILQYIGRCARRGLTTHGQAIFESSASLDRLFEKGAQSVSKEADTIERYAKWFLSGKTLWAEKSEAS